MFLIEALIRVRLVECTLAETDKLMISFMVQVGTKYYLLRRSCIFVKQGHAILPQQTWWLAKSTA